MAGTPGVTAVVPLNQVGVATGVVSVICKVDALASVIAVIGLVAVLNVTLELVDTETYNNPWLDLARAPTATFRLYHCSAG